MDIRLQAIGLVLGAAVSGDALEGCHYRRCSEETLK